MTAVERVREDEGTLLALLAARAAGGPRRATEMLLRSGRQALLALIDRLDSTERDRAETSVVDLRREGVRVLLCDEPGYPARLRRHPGFPLALYCQGPIELLRQPALGVCGSRNAGSVGIKAATACGEEAARCGRVVVSGYAAGVDSASHLAALRSDGATIAVLAEGICRFRLKKMYADLPKEQLQRLLVVSQFPPSQVWTASAANTRNQVIIGLSSALVVVEAGERGGTIRAGQAALKRRHPVWALTFGSGERPSGNRVLLNQGAEEIASRRVLASKLASSTLVGGQLGLAIE